MTKAEQIEAVLMLVMGLLLMREGFSYLREPRETPGTRSPTTDESLVIVLAGPAGKQKMAQAEYLKSRGFAIEGYPKTKEQAARLAALVKHKHLEAPIVIEIADRFLKDAPLDLDMIESYYPEADVWTIDGTRPVETVSRTLGTLLDGTPTGSP